MRTPHQSPIRGSQQGFTLIELLVVITIIGVLAGMLMPALSNAKAKTKRTQCLGNVRQIQMALQMYADDFDDRLPPRNYEAGAVWGDRLETYYSDRKVLRCPVDKRKVENSYLLNGFVDFFVFNLFDGNWDEFFGEYKTGGFSGIKLTSIPEPAQTITVGEKKADSDNDTYMDIWPPEYGSDHLAEVAHGKHRSANNERAGGSNYSFADGSARFLKFGATFSPKNLWAVTEQFRNAPLPEL
ncbi:MAG: Type II secretion system protein G [Verrucomicrobia subdivision 3 bacterium]|nr:Type II secretion system protein G [Limisphaerales bacterium]MCS1416571.1 Type II secretion system protein G [Limisphaerales bacterium]